MKKRLALWSGYLGFVFLLASCGSTAHIEKDDNTNFADYKTFAWVDKDGEGRNDRNRSNDLTEQQFKSAVTKELVKTAGWRESKNRPDVLLSYDVLVEKGLKQDNNPVYSNPTTRTFFNPRTRRYVNVYYPSQFLGYDRDMREVREGTVTITMVDAQTDKTVWQGWTTDEVRGRNLSSKEIEKGVRSIFRKFDVAKN